MDFLAALLPIIIYFLLIIILVVGIILGIRTINTMKKVEKVVDNVNEKVESLNGFFQVLDFAADKLAGLTERIVDGLAFLGTRLFFGKKKNKKEEKEEE